MSAAIIMIIVVMGIMFLSMSAASGFLVLDPFGLLKKDTTETTTEDAEKGDTTTSAGGDVGENSVKIFDDEDGESLIQETTLGSDENTRSVEMKKHDVAKSIKIGSGVKVEVFEHEQLNANKKGKSKTLGEGFHIFDKSGDSFKQNMLSSFKISKSSYSSGDTEYDGQDCIKVKDEKCSGKSGNDRKKCVDKVKKDCMAGGGYWDTEGKFVYRSSDDVKLLAPEEIKKDKDENCVYFYDLDGNWTESSAPRVRGKGRWCLSDNSRKYEPGNARGLWDLKDKSGTMGADVAEYMRLGKNVKVAIWRDNSKPDSSTDWSVKGQGTRDILEGSSYGVSKIIPLEKTTVGKDSVGVFQLQKIGQDFVNL